MHARRQRRRGPLDRRAPAARSSGPPPALLGWLSAAPTASGCTATNPSRPWSHGDDYTGHVKPGSPDVRELTDLVITKASVGAMDNNAYLLRCRDTDEQVLIDAAAEPDTLLGLVGDGSPGRW